MGRPTWTSKVPTEELQAIHEWIDDTADYSAQDIYRHLNLARYTRPRSFREYVAGRRAASKSRIESGVLPPESFSPEALRSLAQDATGKAMLTGDIPGYALPRVLTALARLEVGKYAADENRRKQEWHEARMAEHRAKQEKALDELEGTTPGLTPEVKAKIKRQVLGL